MNIKYLILDFGKVLAYPVSGHWFITPDFFKVVKKEKINMIELEKAFKENGKELDGIVKTENEEFEMFKKFYIKVFKDCKYEIEEKDVEKIAYEITYKNEKYKLYDDVHEQLEKLSKKYKLILLSDNWPDCFRMMKEWNLEKYFDNVYVSSIYGVQKADGVFFDYPIKEYNINRYEAIFVDDNINLIKIAKEKGLIPILMDRENVANTNEFKVIHNLKEIEEENV